MINIVLFLINDKFIFWAFEAALLLITFYAFIKEIINQGSGFELKRGNESQRVFTAISSILASVVIAQIVSISEEGKGYKVLITIVDLTCVFYLSLFNSWSRNKIVGYYGKFIDKVENH